MAKIIIGIHGLANKPEEKIQADGWKKSIAEGLRVNCNFTQDFNFDCVYWANRLYKYPLHNDANFTFDALYDDEPYIPAKPGALQKYEDKWSDRMRADVSNVLGNAVDGVKKAFGMDAVADFFIAQKLKDLDFYYDDKRQLVDDSGNLKQARIVLQESLTKKLVAHKADEIMLIAHSMGSIIAYDVLRNLGNPNQGIEVSRFVTIGSPLGLSYVKLRVAQERTYDPTVRTPSIVRKSWVNFADRKDPVAFDTHLRDDYKPNRDGIEVKDDLILNDYENNGKHNHHKLFGYLRAPEVSEHIRNFLGP